MAETFDDSEFGKIEQDSLGWLLPQSVTFNGVEVPVRLYPEDENVPGISPIQRQALHDLFSLSPDVLEKSAPAVVQNFDVYYDAIGDDEDLPPLGSPMEVWKLVTPEYFMIEPHGDFPIPTFFLYAECEWDPEHGLMVRFRNGVADASDQQGEQGMED